MDPKIRDAIVAGTEAAEASRVAEVEQIAAKWKAYSAAVTAAMPTARQWATEELPALIRDAVAKGQSQIVLGSSSEGSVWGTDPPDRPDLQAKMEATNEIDGVTGTTRLRYSKYENDGLTPTHGVLQFTITWDTPS